MKKIECGIAPRESVLVRKAVFRLRSEIGFPMIMFVDYADYRARLTAGLLDGDRRRGIA